MNAHRHADGPQGWARLTDDDLVHEIAANRRAERWFTVAGACAALLTVLVVLVVAALR
ncbi:hypothetical protein [Cellulomonas sp. B6]|jgi:hypothetical protein|uniref:hypothetical protein n=1 Tax=Cellulomonas sp. B6 TaxID=1295626 RepID=UPI000AE28C7D|nr:hypothetical protein [Cellulomonas sp. B6]